MRILLVGHGKMGRLIERHAGEHGCEIAGIAEVDRPLADAARAAGPVDVAIDFSQPDAVAGNLRALAGLGLNVVVGTTGWQDDEAELREVAAGAGIGVFVAANFSLGMHVFAAVVAEASRRFAGLDGIGASIHETHHAAKKDAPSGTALMLQTVMTGAGYRRRIDVACTRAGYAPGTHVISFDGPAETVTLAHTVRDRAVFAHGALEAAKWLKGRRGWFSMHDMMNG
jgi:4-hydroxy-tetrahydrodipicolinate reductase